MLDRDGTVKLLDLGLARFTEDPARNQGITDRYDKHIVIGTVDFMAPEQAFETRRRGRPVGHLRPRLHAVLPAHRPGAVPGPDGAGEDVRPPDQGPGPGQRDRPAACRPELIAVLDQMMAKEPGDRYQTPAEVVEALAELDHGRGPAAAGQRDARAPGQLLPARAVAAARVAVGADGHPEPDLAGRDQADLEPGPWDLPRLPTRRARRHPQPPATAEPDPSIVLATAAAARPCPGCARPAGVRRLVRLAELVLFVLAAGGVGWLASREWMHRGSRARTRRGPRSPRPKARFAGPGRDAGGVTFADPLIRRWAAVYEKQHGVRLDYQPVGMDKGSTGCSTGCTRSAARSSRSTDEQLAEPRGRATSRPRPAGPGAVAVAYNLPDVTEPLRFTGPVLADIYLGKITRWNDPALAASNPGVELPDLPITVVHHAEPTGTTYLWTDYPEPGRAPTGSRSTAAKSEHAWPVGDGREGERRDGRTG